MSLGDSNACAKVAEINNPEGSGVALILCEHASNHIPEAYSGLGLLPADRDSHAAWDPGARAIALHLSEALNSPMVAGRVSRLVYDCNRPPEAVSAMPEKSELVEVPGNRNLTDAERQLRVDEIYRPFCHVVSDVITSRKAAGIQTVLITIHSFTPVYFGQQRAVEIGILHDDDRTMADAMLANTHSLQHRRVERNQPYGPQDGVTHSLQLHGLANGLANVMIEVRNDLLRTPEDEVKMAEELLVMIKPALATLAQQGGDNA
ncbi:N-formylglutamate amidohydrolase [Parasedimentitalea maritima]|uniref:N-formylglutamate amidohydrolase n=1 Tax=Parasedimentitalea maritima TaxID=2578117 RepID=A0ABY2URL0_9RHOB|nr:N-formylglutamate amidohydrolase [Zongyanglinia marina]TLP59367.1 N-formylglutamate amidohydrolase [Zongyanglinia marina]